ncbi:hypothetical protein Tco_0447553, partial [Tanacetum coccineum]
MRAPYVLSRIQSITQEPSTLRILVAKNINIRLDAEEEINIGIKDVNT